jgi:hypothetical protein
MQNSRALFKPGSSKEHHIPSAMLARAEPTPAMFLRRPILSNKFINLRGFGTMRHRLGTKRGFLRRRRRSSLLGTILKFAFELKNML